MESLDYSVYSIRIEYGPLLDLAFQLVAGVFFLVHVKQRRAVLYVYITCIGIPPCIPSHYTLETRNPPFC